MGSQLTHTENTIIKITCEIASNMAEIVHKLKINGMTCGGCSKRVNTVLSEASWIIDVDVSHESGDGYVTTLSDVSVDRVIEMINSTGYQAIEI